MCGIAGLLLPDGHNVDVSCVLDGFSKALRHRGPDDVGFLGWDVVRAPQSGRDSVAGGGSRVSLMHRRLSILDLSDHGWQPMSTVDGRFHIAFNGEIYNFVELRAELSKLGYSFLTATDTEVLIAAVREWGVGALKRFVGMFAFALLDCRRRTLILARDCFGIKPLYYTYWRSGLAFASETSALLSLPGVSRRVNPQRAFDYARFGITDHEDQTLFAGIRQLAAAHWAEVSLDGPFEVASKRYWSLSRHEVSDISFDEAVAHTRDLFLESIRLHLRSDVPVGSALSGGIDSSAIVAAIRAVAPQHSISTFSYVSDEPSVSEESWVDIVVSHVQADGHKVSLSAGEFGADLEHLISLQGEPFGSTTIYAQYRVFRLAAEAGIKVMLDGQGADEILGGYPACLAGRLATLIRSGQWLSALRLYQQAPPRGRQARQELLWQAGAALAPSGLETFLRRVAKRDLCPTWMNHRWLADAEIVPTSLTETFHEDVLRDMLHYFLTRRSLPALLRYEDRNSMIHSIESRVPFLTPEFAGFLLSLPEDYLIGPDGESKRVFRAAMRGLVPDVVLNRRDKVGFDTPERRWMVDVAPWVNEVLKSDAAERVRILDLPAVRRDWHMSLSGRASIDSRVWRWVNLIRWADQCEVEF
jgi:asparagine synthase (glutamine-hydrolysing)